MQSKKLKWACVGMANKALDRVLSFAAATAFIDEFIEHVGHYFQDSHSMSHQHFYVALATDPPDWLIAVIAGALILGKCYIQLYHFKQFIVECVFIGFYFVCFWQLSPVWAWSGFAVISVVVLGYLLDEEKGEKATPPAKQPAH